MKKWVLAICVILACANYADALTTVRKEVRRGDKISDSFKQLDLPEAEIDPNIGPTLPNAEEVVGEVGEVGEVAEAAASAVDGNAETAVSAAENEISPAVSDAVEAVSTSPALTEETNPVNEDDPNQLSKYCKCSDTHCDCCRNFQLPILPVRGPGCAKITYLGNERMSVSIKYGDIVLATRTISGKKAKPICVSLPGGFSKFCGRVYGLSKGKDDFKACLGLELRADEEVEASLRVSCFKFGAKGLQVAEAEPLPEVPKEEEEDDDIFGFGAGGGSDDDYDDEDDEEDEDEVEDDDDEVAGAAATDDADYDGFSFLGSGLLDELDDSEETSSSPVQATRNERNDLAQSKDEEGTPLAGESVAESSTVDAATKPKPDGTKVKKNKKKKKKADESSLAFDILNGILDFFN